MKPSLGTFAWLVAVAMSTDAWAQVTYEQQGGVTYQVTRSPKSVPVTELQTQQQTTYVPQTTTHYQSYQQTYVTPVTQYQWVAQQRGQWNPFGRPYWTTELQPVTTWQTSHGTVHVPTTQTQMVAKVETRQVPVVTYKTYVDESRIALGPTAPSSAGQTAIATRPNVYGGQQMTSDIPRR